MPTDTTDDLPEIELIETSRFELPEGAQSKEAVERGPIMGGTTVVIIAVAAIVVGLIAIPRTVTPVALNQVPSQTTANLVPTTSIPDDPGGAVSQSLRATEPARIPLFDESLTTELPGVLSAVDASGSLIVIDRTKIGPEEIELGMTVAADDPRSTLIVDGARPIPVQRELTAEGTQVVVHHRDGRFLEPSFALEEIAPDREGTAVVVAHEAERQEVVAVPLAWDGVDADTLLEWSLPGQSLDVLGVWGDRLVVHQANRVWLLTTALDSTLVGEGRLLAYDGAHLSRLVCDQPTRCSLAVGPPDDPSARVVTLPPTLGSLDVDDWAGSVSVSPDGRRLAASVRYGTLFLPVVVDLETGATESVAEGANQRAPMAWSPDGEWLGFVYTDDIVVWNPAEQRQWRIPIDRELETLLWR